MDQVLDQLEQPGTLVYGMCLVIITFFFRRLVETTIPSLKKMADVNAPAITYASTAARYWNDVVLHALPSLFGAATGVFDIPYLYGSDGPKTMGGRIFSGIFIGGISGFLYKAAKKRWGIDLDVGVDSSTPPPPP